MADLKYGEIQTSKPNTFHEGEPLFILRAQDRAALNTLWYYHHYCRQLKADSNHLGGIEKVAEEFEKWKEDNRDLMKVPD